MEMSIHSAVTLNNGVKMPVLGCGVFRVRQGEEARATVRTAIEYGYRMIDTARVYCNERSVGLGIADSGVKREELFVTTKLWKTDWNDPRKGLMDSLERMKLSYVDLYLLHWPFKGFEKVYRVLETLQEEGLCRAIGVSNFKIHHLKELMDSGIKVIPQVNQMEIHPSNTEMALTQFCYEKGITMEAYSPLGGEGRLILDDPRLLGMCEYYKKKPSQIILRWDLQRGVIPIPKSVHAERILENSQLFDFDLSQGDIETINDMNRDERRNYDPDLIDRRPSWLEPQITDEV